MKLSRFKYTSVILPSDTASIEPSHNPLDITCIPNPLTKSNGEFLSDEPKTELICHRKSFRRTRFSLKFSFWNCPFFVFALYFVFSCSFLFLELKYLEILSLLASTPDIEEFVVKRFPPVILIWKWSSLILNCSYLSTVILWVFKYCNFMRFCFN